MTQKNRNTVIWSLIAFVLVLVMAATLLRGRQPNANFVISPATSNVVVDGKQKVGPGTVYLKSGNHKLVASFNGFATLTTSFTIGSARVATVNVILTANSQAGYTWLKNHPSDQRIAEAVGGDNFNSGATSFLRQFPVVANLPIQGPGGEYTINYGAASTQSNKSVLEIDITYYTLDAKQSALSWLESQPGYTPGQYTFVYTDATNTPPTVDNPGTH
jgi:hypothetical protein